MGFEKFSRSYFGENYEEAKENYETGVAHERLSFQRRYPGAHMKNFVVDADLSKTGNVKRTFTRSRNENGELFEITGDLFKRFYAESLYWQPRAWGPYGTVQPFVPNTEPLPFNVTKFNIHVNEEESFLSNFEPLKTSWKGAAKDITKVAVDEDDPLLRLPAGRVHNFSRWRDKQKAPRRDGTNSEARDEHGEVPRVLLHEKIHRRSKKDGFLHHERDERARKGQPADENHMEEKVCQNPGRESLSEPGKK